MCDRQARASDDRQAEVRATGAGQHGRSVQSGALAVARTIIAAARQRYASVQVIEITAPPELLTERLARRGRETSQDQAGRLARRIGPAATIESDVHIENSGTVEAGVQMLLDALGATGGALRRPNLTAPTAALDTDRHDAILPRASAPDRKPHRQELELSSTSGLRPKGRRVAAATFLEWRQRGRRWRWRSSASFS